MMKLPKSSEEVSLLHKSKDVPVQCQARSRGGQSLVFKAEPESGLQNSPTDAAETTRFESAYAKLRFLMWGTALIHAVSAISIIGLYANKRASDPEMHVPRGDGRVERIASCWVLNETDTDTNNTTNPFMSITNRVSTSTGMTRHNEIAGLVMIFFLLSAAFQFVSLIWKKVHMENTRTNAPQWLRYTEYSITASCMMVTIFLGIGLLEVYLHLCVLVLTGVCMLVGLTADYLRHVSGMCEDNVAIRLRSAMVPLIYIGWVCMVIPWAIVFQAFRDLQNSTWEDLCATGSAIQTGIDSPVIPTEGGDIPWWVTFIIVTQFMLFNIFGFVQIYQVHRQFYLNPFKKQWLTRKEGYNEQNTGLIVESLFVFLSLTSKTLLGWLLFTQVLLQ